MFKIVFLVASAIECASSFFGKSKTRASFCTRCINLEDAPSLGNNKNVAGNQSVYIHAYISRFLLMLVEGLACFGKNYHVADDGWKALQEHCSVY